MATWNSTRVWLVASFLLVSAATALALAAWSVPTADQQFDRVERVAVVGSATDAAAGVSHAAPSSVAPSLSAVSRDDQVSLWLVGRDGRDIARSALPVLNRRSLPGADAAVAAALDGRRTLPPDGSNVWVVALPVRLQSGERAALLAYATESGFGNSASRVLHRQLLYGTAIALLAALVIGLLIADRVSRRVQRIARAAEQIADGDFSEPLNDGFGDEIGVLAHSIDAMRERLAANFAAISSERQRLSTVLDELDEAVLTVAPDGRVEVANHATAVLLGDRPTTADELLEMLEPDAPPPLDARERVWRLADGYVSVHGRTLFLQVTPLAHADGEARLVVLADRTAEQQREETERRFIANASHELRTPLAAIVAAVEVLQTGAKDDDETRDQFLEDLQHEAARLDRLTHSLLTLARIGTGEIDPDAKPVDAGASIRRAASLMQSLATAGGVTIEADGSAEVLADDDVLEQVLLGLVGNAIRHSPGGGTIRLTASGDRGRGVIAVSDTGSGISPAELPRIFDRFYQVDRSRAGSGFGLGLAICKEFVTAMGGTIAVSSTVGEGTTFTLRLPGVTTDRTTLAATTERT